jgi:hypothetical protein
VLIGNLSGINGSTPKLLRVEISEEVLLLIEIS